MTDNIIQFPGPREHVFDGDSPDLILELMREFARGEEVRHQARARDADAFVDRVRSRGIASRVSDRQLRQLWEVAASI